MAENSFPTGIIHHASKLWFNYLLTHGLNNEVNFWTKVKGNIKIRKGQLFFFKEQNMIFGYAEVSRVEQLEVREAWEKYGNRNGCGTLNEMMDDIKKSGIPFDEVRPETPLLCIILEGVQELHEILLKEVGFGHIWNFAYLKEDTIKNIEEKVLEKYNPQLSQHLGSPIPKLSLTMAKSRLFQQWFRTRILDIYSHRCALCNCDIDTVLQASHIVEVEDDLSAAADPDNGLCLCANHHIMFDENLISIVPRGENGIVKLQQSRERDSLFLSEESDALEGSILKLPSAETAKYLSKRNKIHRIRNKNQNRIRNKE